MDSINGKGVLALNWKKVWGVITFVLLFTVFSFFCYSYVSVTFERKINDPEFCVSCHEMKYAYYSWKATSHSTVNCLSCHENPDLFKMVYRHRVLKPSGQVIKKIVVQDQKCEKCHLRNRKITPSWDLKDPHPIHFQKGLYCVDCHYNVAHGKANFPEKSEWTTYYNDAILKKISTFTSRQNQVDKGVCNKCHNGKMASKTCDTCHIQSSSKIDLASK